MNAKEYLDKIIKKGRLHLYKPTQIAEVLYRDRIFGVNFDAPETFINQSKKWRDSISNMLVHSQCTSSDSYQKALFTSEMPIEILKELAILNRQSKGGVEAYIYRLFANRFNKMVTALNYCSTHDQCTFDIEEFLNLFLSSNTLRKSVDKIFEIIVYALFTALVDIIDLQLTLSANPNKKDILKDFSDFTEKVIGFSKNQIKKTIPAHIHRAGFANAADGGIDMWSSFGMAIQIKHIDLDEESAKKIVSGITADKIVIVCKEVDKAVIKSVLTQIGWKSRIQSIITEKDLIEWYNKALRGKYSNDFGNKIINIILDQIQKEFPSTNDGFTTFWESRMYSSCSLPEGWQ